MQLVFLGTAAGWPSLQRNVSCTALNLLAEQRGIWLFDCGEATQHQLLRSKLKMSQIEKIFITHLHGDHVFGLVPLLCSLSMAQRNKTLCLYGPVGLKKYVETSLAATYSQLTFTLLIEEITPGVVFVDQQFSVTTYPQLHRCPSFAYRIVEKDRPGTLLAEKLKQLRIPAGPWLQRLKDGHNIITPSGEKINSADYLGDKIRGRVVAIFGDTATNPNQLPVAQDANVIVHEATYRRDKLATANEYGHSISIEVANMAKRAKAKRLIITHISTRYSAQESQQLLHECQSIFPNTCLANDFAEFTIEH